MNKKLAAIWCLLLIIAVLIVSGSSAMSQSPQPVSALVKIDLGAKGDLQRVEAGGLAVYARLTTGDEDYLIAGATEDDLDLLASQGLSYRVLDEELAPGEYYLVYPRRADQLSLIRQHGRLLHFDGLRALIRAPAAEAEELPALGLEIRWLPDRPIRLSPRVEAAAYASLGDPDPLIEEMMAQVDSATVYLYDGNLSGENEVTIGGQPYTINTRYSYSGEPVEKATQFVYEHFQNLGLEVEYHNYNWWGNYWRNVVATKPGLTDPDDIYVVCAHVDSISNDPYNYAPGADDNASGTTAVMIAADILSQYDFGYTIRFVTFTGEEQGLRGSHCYAQDAYYEGDNILGVLNLDMIAYDSDDQPIFELHAGTGAGSIAIANLFTDVVDTYDIDLTPEIITAGATNRSDHASFWDYGYDAILAIEDWDDFTPYYHTTNDQLSSLNIPYFTEFVKASVGTVASMARLLSDQVSLRGAVHFWQDSAGVPGVLLTLEGDQAYTGLSRADGSYTVSGVVAGDYILTPSKSDGVNGIGAYDASLALQHEAGLITLSGYAATAGDVNKSGGISSTDASYILQKAVDLIALPFPGAGAVWEFDPANRTYTDLSGSVSGQDFTATLLGDVSGSWAQVGFSTEGSPSPNPSLRGRGTETPPPGRGRVGGGGFDFPTGRLQAANTASLALPNLYAEPGERITVTLEIVLDQAEVYGVDIAVSYDPTVVSVASASAGDAAQDFVAESNLSQPGLVRMAMAGAQPITEGGHLLALVFDVVGGLDDTSPLQITAIELNEDGVTAQPQGGSVTVVDFPDYDFDRDCTVGMTDIMEVASRWHTTDADPDWDALYDLDGDGVITVVDIMIVAVNWGATCW
ncbi:MAG: M28 family peptidase [Anaerolineae bacterium]|nr:M28 family peptidase [Anaerolineae bacterium]